MSTDRWMYGEVVVHICNWILFIHKKERVWVSSNEVTEPKAYYKGEVSQKEKSKYNILTYYMDCRKMVIMNLFAGQQWRWRHREQTCGHSGGRSCCSVTLSCPTLCNPMDHSTPVFSVLHHLPKLAQTHVHWVSDTIPPSHPLSSPSPLAFNLSHHQGLF